LNKQNFYKILFLVLFWVLALIFISFYDWSVLIFDPIVVPPIDPAVYDFHTVFAVGLAATVIGGIFIAYIEVMYFSKLLRKMPFGVSLLVKITFYSINIFFFTSLATVVTESLDTNKSLFNQVAINQYLRNVFSPRMVLNWIYWSLMVALALFILQISEKLGQGVLINYIIGRYHHPKEESRIFMFLDLKSSTIYAEKLGHIKYSRLIQDCYFDLTEVVSRRKARIYQYVGDEVVLSWNFSDGVLNNNCLKLFFDYLTVLENRKKYYESMYGFIPEFKAGMDAGDITVAEVGEIKKELAYHGDVLNTAARIQSKCNEFNTNFLISEELKNLIDTPTSNIEFEPIYALQLKGKENPVTVFKVKLILA
jgi:adenylate cyclase